jgi:hypothetical protein
MKEKIEVLFLIISSIVVGLTLGILLGVVCWLKFPHQIYINARAHLARNRIIKSQNKIKELREQNDIWERHINRMKEKKSYDN